MGEGSAVGQKKPVGSELTLETDPKELEKIQISTTDPDTLEKILNIYASHLESTTRKEPSKYSKHGVEITIILSIGIFLAILVGMVLNQTGEFAERIQYAIIMSASGGVIPGIGYAIFRDREKERKNEELESISLKMRGLRSRILLIKQEKAVEDLRRQKSKS